MESNWVLERTDIGQAEIAHRTLKLPMTVRAVLLMVDGKSEVTQLQRKMVGLPDGLGILQSLLNNGLIRQRHYSSDSSIRASSQALANSQKAAQQTLSSVSNTSNHISQISASAAAVTAAAVARAATAVASIVAPAHPAESAPAPAAAVASTPVGKQRKSLALARMYLLDQMERKLGDRSDAARNLLRTATTREALVSVYADCKEILIETSGAERTERIEQEFYSMLPESVTG
ncbi:MAG TPA: hypothetical protein VL381_07560 [Rhodocyclaceae bacterium]|nr:hypothetical protein [Rhodocyclaceae bacterium]